MIRSLAREMMRESLNKVMPDIAGKTCEEHLYGGVHTYASMLEKRGFAKAAQSLRQLLPQKTDPLYDTDMREALRLYHLVKTGRLEIVTPTKDQTL